MNYNIPEHLTGLTDEEVKKAHKKWGYNQMDSHKKDSVFTLLINIAKDPMLMLLLAVTVVYLIVGEYDHALFMLAAIGIVSGISFYQDNQSKKALEELEKLNEPLSQVIRNSQLLKIPTHEITVGDLCVSEEGQLINADGQIVHSNDFSVNESMLTGESLSVFKDRHSTDNKVYSGTICISGLAVFEVEKIGKDTEIGKIGKSLSDIKDVKSPLQLQINHFVKVMAIIGIVVFLLVWAYSYYQSGSLTASLLIGLTLAMSILPEEIPVAFATFMALGAWKLMKEGVIVKRSTLVETLGSTTVICTDKTGTITENSMKLKFLYDFKSRTSYSKDEFSNSNLKELIEYAMWSSEPVPFDPMEITLHKVYEENCKVDERKEFELFHEYPLDGKPPMMTHLFENPSNKRIIAAKGAPEAILKVVRLTENEKESIRNQIVIFGNQGYRILGVAKAEFEGNDFPKNQQDFDFEFLGLVVFYDPPKEGINEVFQHIYDAGIKLKVITGDNAQTTQAIASQAGIVNHTDSMDGEKLMHYSDKELGEISDRTTLFTRMFPEAKLKIVNALKRNGDVVAMLGDGVNDAPALKSAHIGVAMGTKGTEIAKAAADLVITHDDLEKLVVGIAAGRRIYANLKKAIQYIISIHIPIVLTVSLPLFLGWIFPHIFTPVHVIFLELVMGPTCSIVYENEPIEKNAMKEPPRSMSETFLSRKELKISIIQGLLITIGVLGMYQFSVHNDGNEEQTRAMVFSTLIFANVFLSFVNRSFYYSVLDSFSYKNPLLVGISTLVILSLIAILYFEPFARFFHVSPLHITDLLYCLLAAGLSVGWFEGFKWMKRRKRVVS